jgi:hypothetical protein
MGAIIRIVCSSLATVASKVDSTVSLFHSKLTEYPTRERKALMHEICSQLRRGKLAAMVMAMGLNCFWKTFRGGGQISYMYRRSHEVVGMLELKKYYQYRNSSKFQEDNCDTTIAC